jgi:DNA-binding response OmpR family regulator
MFGQSSDHDVWHRQASYTQTPQTLCAGELEIVPGEGLVRARSRPLTLSVRELELLTELARRRDRIASRGELYQAVWNQQFQAGDRSIDVYVGKLRAKLSEAIPDWKFIHTHFGFGYRFAPEPSQALYMPDTKR